MKKAIILLLCFYMNTTMPQQIITLFVHGIADSGKQALPFAQTSDKPYIVEGPLATFDFDCSTQHFWRIHMPACSLGQESELEQLALEWQKLNEQFPLADGFVLIGVSRGASAILNFLATHKPEKIKAVILESPFDNIESTIQHRAERLGVPACVIRTIVSWLFWQFDPEGICPDKLIDQIKQDIPMLFVTVEDDHSVPIECAHKLLAARKELGHRNCHHLHLMQGRHGKIMQGPDAHIYQGIAHAFYAHYGLPHNNEHAQCGSKQFSLL